MKRHEWVNVGRAERRRGKWRKEGFHRGRYLGEKMRERGEKNPTNISAASETDSQCTSYICCICDSRSQTNPP